jgi:3D (Asp-Asp-Asp) domain-containing protein
VKELIILALLLTSNPGPAQTIGPEAPKPVVKVKAVATAYCLRGNHTASGKVVYRGCIALSRCLVKRLKAHFGDLIVVEGIGTFVFDDLMPPKWQHPRVDIHYPTLKECYRFPNGEKFLVWKK